MQKLFVIVSTILFCFTARAEDPHCSFQLTPKLSLGVGYSGISVTPGYLLARINLLHHGSKELGLSYLGVGAAFYKKETVFLITPISIYLTPNLQVGQDFGPDLIGVSLAFRF
jgi:hypothetical protein